MILEFTHNSKAETPKELAAPCSEILRFALPAGSLHIACMSSVSLSGLDVLVVDDDVMLRRRMVSVLERLGADVTSVENLQAARTFIAAMSFDFALLDVNLPDGLGTDLLKKKIFPTDTTVIVITAHGGVSGAVEAMRHGAADYLVKPFETEELPLVTERARRSARRRTWRFRLSVKPIPQTTRPNIARLPRRHYSAFDWPSRHSLRLPNAKCIPAGQTT